MIPPNDMPADTELRTELHNLLDSFFEPNGGERYISDLERDIMQLIAARDEEMYLNGYKQGVIDEIECVETSGEHINPPESTKEGE